MKILLIVIGKTDAGFVREGIAEYEKRLKHYVAYEMKVIPDVKNVKNMSEAQQKEREGEFLRLVRIAEWAGMSYGKFMARPPEVRAALIAAYDRHHAE